MLSGRPTDTPSPPREHSWARVVWFGSVALSFFFLSSPLALVPEFDDSLTAAVASTTLAAALTLPVLRMPRVPWPVVPFLLFCLASVGWTIDAGDTVHFLGLYVVLAALAVVTATNVDSRTLASGVVAGAVLVMVASVYAYARDLPNARVPAGTSGYLAGVGSNRNILAYTMILAFPFAVALVPRGRVARVAWAVSLVVVLSGILLTESATGVAAVCVISGMAGLLALRDGRGAGSRRRATRHVGVGVALVAATAVVVAIGAAWYVSLGRDFQRDLSLTGRTAIWQAAWETSSDRARVIGNGFGAVWMHPWRYASANGQFEAITREIGRYEPHGHNAVMDLVPEVGLVGVALFAMLYVAPLVRALARRRDRSPVNRAHTRLVVLGVVALVMAGVTEPLSTVPLGFYLAVLIIAHDPRRAQGLTSAEERPAAG